jgi:hypothetical protein
MRGMWDKHSELVGEDTDHGVRIQYLGADELMRDMWVKNCELDGEDTGHGAMCRYLFQ